MTTSAGNWEQRLRDAIEAYNRGDYEAVIDLASDDVELQRAGNAPESREVLRGRAQLLEFFRPQAFDDQQLKIGKIVVGTDAIVARMIFTARGRGSGIPVEIESWAVYRVEGETLTRIEIYNDEQAAREAAGVA